MSKFADRNGKEHELSLTVGALSDVRKATTSSERPRGIDLGKVMGSEAAFSALFADPVAFVEVLWALVGRPGATDEEAHSFALGFDGPALERASEALTECLIDFFQRSKVAQAMKGRLKEIREAADERAVKAVMGMDLKSTAGLSGVASPSTPAPSPCGN